MTYLQDSEHLSSTFRNLTSYATSYAIGQAELGKESIDTHMDVGHAIVSHQEQLSRCRLWSWLAHENPKSPCGSMERNLIAYTKTIKPSSLNIEC